MSVDMLQDKIRKLKNPSMLEFSLSPMELPTCFTRDASGYEQFCREILGQMKGMIPAVRFGFASFAILGSEGVTALSSVVHAAKEMGYYVVLDAPEILSPASAQHIAQAMLGKMDRYPCDGLIIGGYLGSDVIKPFLPYCKDEDKDLFVVTRTANKSASELQDLLSGSRLVHTAAADHINRYAGDVIGKCGYSRVCILSAASASDSLRNLRSKYPKLFMLVDGYDYPASNAKNCAAAFDRLGHGAVVCSGRGITCAWKQQEDGEEKWLEYAVAAVERMKKNLTRYVMVL